jgi:YVTN family beta-propeller protein
VSAAWRSAVALLAFSGSLFSQSYTAPAGIRQAVRRAGASILPGGRVIAPFGREYVTGPGPFALAVSPSGRGAVTANAGPWRYSLTIADRDKAGHWEARQIAARSLGWLQEFGASDWKGVSIGVAFSGERAMYVSEGNTGCVSLFDSNDERRRTIDINQAGFSASYTGDLAFDSARGILYVADQANFRIAAIDVRSRQVVASVRVGWLPFALTLAPDRKTLYVTNVGIHEYHALPKPLLFPAPALSDSGGDSGSQSDRPGGPSHLSAPESNSLAIVDVATPAAAKLVAFVRTGLSPSGVVATADRVFVSNAGDDSIVEIDAKTHAIVNRITISIPGLEQLRGVIPLGMAYDEASGWLLVAEAGINAVGVIDTRQRRVLGHIPAAWYPTRVAIDDGEVLVANARGHGIGPDAPTSISMRGSLLPGQLYQGTLSIFPLPAAEGLAALTGTVMRANGFAPQQPALPAPPAGVRHVVLIVKESRSYDEILGGLAGASNGRAMGDAGLARYGTNGVVDGGHQRFSMKEVHVTPNHQAIASQWAFSDNFYADSDGAIDGHHWLTGVYPNAWTESSLLAAYGNLKDFRLGAAPGRLSFPGPASSVQPEDVGAAGTLWSHLASHGISFYNFGGGLDLPGAAGRFVTDMPLPAELYSRTSREYPGFNMSIPDQDRATVFIREVDEKFAKAGAVLPQFLFVYLPGDATAAPRPDSGFAYKESFVADNDLALGRIVQYLSSTVWWKETAVFVTESSALGGIDHIHANRTVLLAAGPWIKRSYVSHINTSFPGLLKTIYWLLGLPPQNLFDASAADLRDCFTSTPDSAPYHVVNGDPRIFSPANYQR